MKVGDEVEIIESSGVAPHVRTRRVGQRGIVERVEPTLWGSRHGGGVLVAINGEEAHWFYPHQLREIDVVTKLGEIATHLPTGFVPPARL